MSGDVARDRELFIRVAQTHPGLVRTLDVLISELADADGRLGSELQHHLGEHIRSLGEKVIEQANRITVDQAGAADA